MKINEIKNSPENEIVKHSIKNLGDDIERLRHRITVNEDLSRSKFFKTALFQSQYGTIWSISDGIYRYTIFFNRKPVNGFKDENYYYPQADWLHTDDERAEFITMSKELFNSFTKTI